MPTLNAIVMDPLKAVISTPLIATASPAVAPALKARLKLLPSLLDGDRKNIEAPPPVFDPAPRPWSHTRCCGHLCQNL